MTATAAPTITPPRLTIGGRPRGPADPPRRGRPVHRGALRRGTRGALDAGGEAFFTGEVPDGPGYWFPTTLVRGVAEGTPLVDEEPFGPVLPILTYRDLDDAVARANDTD